VTKNSREAMAMTISGTINDVYITVSNATRDLRPTLRRPIAAAVPRTVASTAFTVAVHRDRVSALVIDSSAQVVAHHSSPNPLQTCTRRDSLKA
jgi:hypothetical protein